MPRYTNPQRNGRYNNQLARSDNSDETDYTSRYSQGSNYYNDDQYYYESGNQSYISRGNRDSFNSGVVSNQSYQSRGNGDSFNSGVVSNQQDLRSYASGYSDTQSVQSYGASSYHSRQGNQRAQSGNASVCGSTSATTVAGGGRGRCPYQIGFNVQNAGKQISTSKRIVHFRFGFANPQALASGLAGVDCRGQEHDLSITWSITGGKRLITLDGREIQYSAGKRSNTARRADIVEAAWRMADHIFELKLYAYKPKAGSPEKRNPKWKQYNLTIDGRSFFELPEIFDLGLRGLGTGRLPATISSGSDWDERTDTSSKKTSSLSTMTQYSDQSSVKSSIQSRIEEQRRLLNKKKPGATTVKKCQPQNPNASVTSYAASDLTSSNLMSFRTLSVNDDVEDWGVFSSGVYSAEPSELREVRNRQNSAREQTNGAMTVSNRTERRQKSAQTSEQLSALVSQQQAQQAHPAQQSQKRYQPAQQPQKSYQPTQQAQKRYQPQTLPAMSEPPPTVVTKRAEKQYPLQSDTPVQEMSTHITLAPQQPPTYEEITQALVPSSYVPQQNEVQSHSQHQGSPMHHQLQALPLLSSQLQILPEQPAENSSHNQPQLLSSDHRSAQPADNYSHHQPQPTIENRRSPHPASSSSNYQPEAANSAQPTGSSSHYEAQPHTNDQCCTEPAGTSSHYQYKPVVHNKQRSPQRPGASSHYQPQPHNNAQPTGSSPHYQSQPTEPAGASFHSQYKPVHNKQSPEPAPTNDFQPQPTSSNQRSAAHRAVSSQPAHNNQRSVGEQTISKHHEDLPQQPVPGNLPKGTNKFAFF